MSNQDDIDDLPEGFEDYAELLGNDSDDQSEASATSPVVIDPHTQLLEDLQSQIHSLTLEAETVLSRQQRQTQLALRKETKELFTEYEKHGPMARLKVGVGMFLERGDADGHLCFEEVAEEERSGRPAHYGAAFQLKYNSKDDAERFDPAKDFITPLVHDASSPDPNATIHPLRTVDAESLSYITTLPWDPVATKFVWQGRLRMPKGLLSSINKALSLVDYEARNRLFHHVTKYGPSPVFRAGIAARAKAEYSNIFETAHENYLGLTPETRSFLRNIYFQKQIINEAERRLLAQACRADEDSVEMFWDDLTATTASYQAMRIFMAAREIELDREAKKKNEEKARKKLLDERMQAAIAQREQMYMHNRRQEVMRESAEQFRRIQGGGVGMPEIRRQFS